MRLNVSMASANEEIIHLTNSGYEVLNSIRADYALKKAAGQYSKHAVFPIYVDAAHKWMESVGTRLLAIFPTALEHNLFLNPEVPFGAVSGDYEYESAMRKLSFVIRGLERIRTDCLPQYTDLPIRDRLYVEDIDSFQKVRDINPHMIEAFIPGGFLNLPEDDVQLRLEEILAVKFHQLDWGGEEHDLYTANLVVSGQRRSTAFLLKGPAIGKKEMTIADCGKNGDQIVRLFNTPADLFVVQYVGPIASNVIKDVEWKVARVCTSGRPVHYLIMDAQDTARVLFAYGKL